MLGTVLGGGDTAKQAKSFRWLSNIIRNVGPLPFLSYHPQHDSWAIRWWLLPPRHLLKQHIQRQDKFALASLSSSPCNSHTIKYTHFKCTINKSQKVPSPLAILRYSFITYFCMPKQCFLGLGLSFLEYYPIWSLLNFALFTQCYFSWASVVPASHCCEDTICSSVPLFMDIMGFFWCVCSFCYQYYYKLSWTSQLVDMLLSSRASI